MTDRPPSDTNRRYDLFVSYSETARELRIAKALTAALEQIVERARRRDPSRGRSILVYRDERNLAARDLWDQLYQALDESSALVILLSRRAARSPGVGAEIAHWRTLVHAEDPPRRRTHLVFTDSRWLWEAGSHRFVAPEPGPSVSTPPGELADLFPREPKVVDLTWVRRRRDLSIRNQRFHNEVVVLASAVSGIPVDVLRADDRWERRARRTQLIRRWIAGVLVVAALLAAVGRYGYVQTRAERDRRTVDRLLVTSQDAATDPRLALLLAVEAAARRPGADSSENLLALLAGLRFRGALPGTHRNPNAIAVSPGGLVVVGSYDATVDLWFLGADGSSRLLASRENPVANVIAVAVSATSDRLVVAGDDGQLVSWDISHPRDPRQLATRSLGRPARVWGMRFDPGGRLYTGGDDGLVRSWSVDRRGVLRPIAAIKPGPAAINALCLRPGHPELLIADDGGWLTMLSTSGSGTLRTVRRWRGHQGRVYAAAFDPAGEHLLTGGEDRVALLWDVSGVPRTIRSYGERVGAVRSVAYSPDGRFQVVAGYGTAPTLYEIGAGGTPVRATPLPWSRSVLFSAAFTADSRYLLAGGYDSRVSVWRTTPFRDRPPLFTRQLADTVTATATGHGRVAAGSGSGELLVAGVEGGRLGPWQVLPTDGSSQAVTALAWSPDGTTLAVGRGDGQVLRCTPATASCRRLPPAGGDDRVRALVFTRDNALVAAKADALWIWSGSSARARREASGSRSVLGLAATPDGVLAVTAGGRLLRWSVTGSAWGSRTVLASTSALLTALAANQDGSVVIVGDGNGNLTTWRLDHGRTTRVASRSVGRQAVVSMAFVDAGHVVVGAGEGGAVLLRADASRLYVVTTLPGHLGVVPSVAAGPTPSTVLTGGADRTLVWSDLSEPRAVDADPTGFACRIAGRTLSSEERAAYLNGERARGC